MAIDTTSGFVVDQDGIGISHEDSDDLAVWVGGGNAAPNFQAPDWSRYYRTNGELWVKSGPNAGDWSVVRKGIVTQSASPGYNFGRSQANSGTYLKRAGGVASNKVGLPITFNGKITDVFADNQNSTSYTVVIFEHSGKLTARTDLVTLAVSGSTFGNQTGLSVSVTAGKQLGAEITAGTTKNVGVTCILKG